MNDQDRQQRMYVVKLAEQVRTGKIGRRDFIRAAGLAGFGFSSAALLGGCARPRATATAVPTHTASAPSIETTSTLPTTPQQFLREVGGRFKGTRLKVVTQASAASTIIGLWAKEEFTALTGIDVDWETATFDQVLAKTAQDTLIGTTDGAGLADVYQWDQAWLGRFANDSMPIDALLAKTDLAYPDYNFDDFMPQLVQNIASYQGKKIGVPFDIPIFIMMYRKDIFDELKLKVPTTMTEYMDTVRAIYEAKSGEGIMGTVGQWKSGHYALQCDATAWMWSHGGAHFGADGQPIYVTDENIAGMEYMMALGKYMDPGVTGWDWGSQGDAFTQGQAGVFISWGEFFPSFDDSTKSKVAGLVEPADCPREDKLRARADCGFDETPGISHQSGSCLALSKYAPNADAAWVFMQWATSADLTARANTQGANTPIRLSNYTDPRVLEKNKVTPGTTRHFEVTKRAIETRMGTEPHLPQWAALVTYVDAVEYGKMTTQQQSIKETLQAIQDKTIKALAS